LSWGLALAALVLAASAVVFTEAAFALRILALLAGSAAAALHLRLMLRTLRSGMRGELGRSFTLVKIGWGGLAASFALAWALVLELPFPRLMTLFGLCLIGVWLLSLLLGMLQRILPFLGSLHAAAGKKRGPTASMLTHERALKAHFACHLAALAGLALALVLDAGWLARAAALAGLAGAIAFGVFHLHLHRKLRAAGV
jgi:hypothetical protein